MTTLIFDEKISGHHLEYLHHYYRGAVRRPNDEFIFCLEDGFLKQKSQFEWQHTENVSFVFMPSSEIDFARNVSGFKHGWRMSKLIARKSKVLCADRVILTNFMYLIPFLLFLMPKGVEVRGIVYRIYLHTKHKVSKLRYGVDTLLYWMMAKSRAMEKIFILNDQKSADDLNEKFHTCKFTFLPDPVPEIDSTKLVNLRSQYEIPKSNKVFFHFGGLTQRKGTLEILRAINLCSNDDLNDKTFVFAGRIYNEIHDEFYQLLESAKQNAQVLVFDSFCEYEFLHNMCYTSDVILMPYQQTELSSGVLGYAAVFQKPVIGPSNGLIGRLIKQFNMGYALDSVMAPSLSKSFNSDIAFKESGYAHQNDVKKFIKVILD